MEAFILSYKGGLSLKTTRLILLIENGINSVGDGSAVSDYLANYIALEGVAFPDWMVSEGLRFVLKDPAIETLPT